MAKTVKMNNSDVTSYFVPKGMKVTYKKILGENGGTMQNGDIVEDVLAWKAVVTLPCLPLTETQQADFLTKAMSDNPLLYYFDPRANGYRKIHYKADVSKATYRGAGGTGVEYWTGFVLTAEEKCEYAITQQPEDVTIEADEYATFTVKASGENLSYRWQYSTNGGQSWSNSTATSAYSDTYRLKATAARDGYKVRCRVSDGNETLTSEVATLTVTTS